jgi:hypothetical protein
VRHFKINILNKNLKKRKLRLLRNFFSKLASKLEMVVISIFPFLAIFFNAGQGQPKFLYGKNLRGGFWRFFSQKPWQNE